MSISLNTCVHYCDQLLNVDFFRDYCPNGLQVQGAEQVDLILSGVTASQALLEQAVAHKASLVLVHHGYFWKGEDPCVTGMKRERLKLLLEHNISLLAYHLPLDAHSNLGNNAQLAKRLGWEITGGLDGEVGKAIGLVGELPEPVTGQLLAEQISRALGRDALHISAASRPLKKIAWCTGGAQDYIDKAIAAGADVFISGEISERTVHTAREMGIDYIAAGHHATERYGVQALGEHLSVRFGVQHQYMEIDNPA